MTSPANPPASDPKPLDPSPTPLGRLLRPLFRAFADAGIELAVLRNAEGLPDETRHDVDLLVAPGGMRRAVQLIRAEADKQGWSCLAVLDKFEYACVVLASPGPDTRYVPIDLVCGLNHRFHSYADAAFGLRGAAINPQGIPTVREGFEAAVSLLKELLSKGRLKESSREAVRRGVLRDSGTFYQSLAGRLSDGLIRELDRRCREGDWVGLIDLAREVRRQIGRWRLGKAVRMIRFLAKVARHYARPPLSCFLVLIGPDGSGKSSLSDRIGTRLAGHPFKVVRRFKSTFNILPPLKTLKRGVCRLLGRPVPEETPTQPGELHSGMIRPNPVWASMIYAAYYALDLALGRVWLRVLRGRCALIIFDRYYYDYFYQRGNRRLPRWYLNLFNCLVPEPDLVLEIDREAEDIYRRKPELTVEEIRLEQAIIHHLLSGRKSARVVNGRQGLEAAGDEAESLVHRWILDRSNPCCTR